MIFMALLYRNVEVCGIFLQGMFHLKIRTFEKKTWNILQMLRTLLVEYFIESAQEKWNMKRNDDI